MLIAMHSILEMGPLEPYFTFQRHLSHCVKKVALVNQDFEADYSFFTFRLGMCRSHVQFFYHKFQNGVAPISKKKENVALKCTYQFCSQFFPNAVFWP